MSNRQKLFGKAATPHNSKSRARSDAPHLTGSTPAPKLSKLSPSQFVESDFRRGASEKLINMAVVATVAGISIEIKYGYLTQQFFAVTSHGQAVIDIPSLNVSYCTLSAQQLQTVLQWASSRTAALSREWSKAKNGLPVGRIP